jgi:hypothetical protein
MLREGAAFDRGDKPIGVLGRRDIDCQLAGVGVSPAAFRVVPSFPNQLTFSAVLMTWRRGNTRTQPNGFAGILQTPGGWSAWLNKIYRGWDHVFPLEEAPERRGYRTGIK